MLIKDGNIGSSWILMNKNQNKELSNELYYEKQIHNTVYLAEAIVLLELVKVLERKRYHINTGLVVIAVDYKKIYRKIIENTKS